MSSGALRILQVISSDAASGAERHCVDVSLTLKAMGHDVETAVPPRSWLAQELREGGVTPHEIDFRANRGLEAIKRLSLVAKKGEFDLIHSHLSRASTAAWVASLRSRCPLVSTVHIRSKGLIYRVISRTGGWVVAVSEYIQGVLVEAGCRPDRTLAVPNGTDFATRLVPPGPTFRDDMKVPEGAVLVGLVGRVAREKGQHIALEALGLLAKSHPHIHLAFVGRNSQPRFQEALEARVKELGLEKRVHLTGMRSDIPRVIDGLDFLVMPSEMEACPLSALEAMSRGKSLVAARVGGLPEMVPHGEVGFLADLDPESFAAPMARMSEDPCLRQELGEKARSWVASRYTREAMMEGLIGVYRTAVKK